MVISPLIERELQRALRKGWPHRVRSIAAIGSCLLAFFTYTTSNQFPTPNAAGRWLFFTISTVILTLCAFAGPLLTSLALREEKRTRMLDLLLLSKVGPSGILISKLLIHSNPTIQILLSSLPIVALPMLFGGVSSTEVFRMSILCLSTLGLSSVTGLYAASVCHSGKSSAILSGLILTAVSLGSYIVDRIGIGAEGIYGLPGLIQGFATTSDLAQTMAPLTFWTSIQTMIILTTGLFILATRQLPRATIDGATNHQTSLKPQFSVEAKSRFNSPTIAG